MEEEDAANAQDHMQVLMLSTATARLDMAFQKDVSGEYGNNDHDENSDDNDYGFDGDDFV